jgi:hypothetical protein
MIEREAPDAVQTHESAFQIRKTQRAEAVKAPARPSPGRGKTLTAAAAKSPINITNESADCRYG